MSIYKDSEILYDLPSPYISHSSGLLHLPRFIAKIKKHLKGELPASYQRNYKRGFDRYLCLHLGVEPNAVEKIVADSHDDAEIDRRLLELFPDDLNLPKWNRQLCQIGMSEAGREKLAEIRMDMGISDRTDLLSFADMIDFDEGRIP